MIEQISIMLNLSHVIIHSYMEFWGNILKETAKIGYKRQVRKSQKLKDQNHTLKTLLFKAKLTDFGVAHGFNETLKSENPVERFKATVPITNYEEFYEKWLHQSLKGKKNVIWPGKIPFYALSSGTTNSASKRIPVTDSMIRQFQKSTVKQVVGLHDLNLPTAFFESNVLIIGGSTKLKKIKGAYEGDLSGILAKNKSFMLSPFTKPTKRIAKIPDWSDKMDAIVEKAPKWDIGIIAGVPSWIAVLLERIIKRYDLNNIHEIWPNFTVYTHGGIFLKPYQEKLESMFGKEVIYQNTYLASEGYFAYQRNYYEPGLEMLLCDGVYFEFVEEKYFNDLNERRFENIKTLDIEEVKPHTPYALLISTCSGLWRYSIGDVIEFIDMDTKRINIAGRISYGLSVTGEHLSDGNILKAIHMIAEKYNLAIEEFCVYPAKDEVRHLWYIGCNQTPDMDVVSKDLDRFLSDLNDDYYSQRKYDALKAPIVERHSPEVFMQFMKRLGKIGGQHKFPRVMKPTQIETWESLLQELQEKA